MDNISKNHHAFLERKSRESAFDFTITKTKKSNNKHALDSSSFVPCRPKQTLQIIDEHCVLELPAKSIKTPKALQFSQCAQLPKTEINLQLVRNNRNQIFTQTLIHKYIQTIIDSIIKPNPAQKHQTILFNSTAHVNEKLFKKLNRYMTIKAIDASINGISSIVFFATIKPLFAGFYHDFVIKTSDLLSEDDTHHPHQDNKQLLSTCSYQRKMQTVRLNFMAEATILSQVKHKNIVELLGYSIEKTFQNSCSYFLILKRYHIDSFQFFYKTNPTIQKKSQTIFLLFDQILAALEYLKDQHIIHGDVKLENFFGNQDQTIWCLGDFGNAEHSIDNKALCPRMKGTVGYQPYEVFQYQYLHQCSDLYSWGQSMLALYEVNNLRYCFHKHYQKYLFELIFFNTNQYIKILYFDFVKTVGLCDIAFKPKKIIQHFQENPIQMAEKLWAKHHLALFSKENSAQSIQSAHDAMHTILMPMIMTTARYNPVLRESIHTFRQYLQYLLTQYQQHLETHP
ncbi:MAG: protein kinase family protein [Endozoicomonadaceae bacterium]|nr:protein kinase family protein [Endozoicomonadaceae bacterium]